MVREGVFSNTHVTGYSLQKPVTPRLDLNLLLAHSDEFTNELIHCTVLTTRSPLKTLPLHTTRVLVEPLCL